MNSFQMEAPDSRADALALLARHGDAATLIAGGTGLLNLMKQRLAFPELLVSLHRVTGMSDIALADGVVRIGALVRLAELEHHPLVREHWPMLHEALREVASPRVRAMATVGGALAHGDPHQDTPAALTALGAAVLIESQIGQRELPIDELYLDYYETRLRPDELLTELRIPLPQPHSSGTYVKFLPRSAEDYATVAVAVQMEIEPGDGSGDGPAGVPDGIVCRRCSIVLGSLGSTPVRARAAEAMLAGALLTADRCRAAAARASEEAEPLSDTRGSAEYKREMAAVFVRRALIETAARLAALPAAAAGEV